MVSLEKMRQLNLLILVFQNQRGKSLFRQNKLDFKDSINHSENII